MKTLLAALAVLLGASSAFAQTQGVAMRATNGFAYGTLTAQKLTATNLVNSGSNTVVGPAVFSNAAAAGTFYGQLRVQGVTTNSQVIVTNGSLWFQSAIFGDLGNSKGGGLNWMQQGNTNPSGYIDGGASAMGQVRVFDNWGGVASGTTSPWMLLTAPNVRIEEGSASATTGIVMLGNEDSSGNVDVNFNRGTLNQQRTTTNYTGFSHPLGFVAAGTGVVQTNEYLARPGIIGVTAGTNAPTDAGGYYAGELWFQSLVPSGVNGGYAQNGANTFLSNTVAKMHTNSWEFSYPVQLATNALSDWPTAAATHGGCAFVMSNNVLFVLTSTLGSTAWAATNKIAP